MADFYVTFGSKWGRQAHPTLPMPLIDPWTDHLFGMPYDTTYPHPYGWAVVEAWNSVTAHEIANAWLGPENFACIYIGHELNTSQDWQTMFPLGELARMKAYDGFSLLSERKGY